MPNDASNYVIGGLGLLGATLAWLANMHWRLAQIAVKVETMWQFQLRRGIAEAVHHGMATVNSPFVITEEAKSWLDDLAVPLRQLYQKLGRHVSDTDLLIEIELRFGDEIVKKVCIPHGVDQGVCLVIALAVAKGE